VKMNNRSKECFWKRGGRGQADVMRNEDGGAWVVVVDVVEVKVGVRREMMYVV
jgi:hypothetical protein